MTMNKETFYKVATILNKEDCGANLVKEPTVEIAELAQHIISDLIAPSNVSFADGVLALKIVALTCAAPWTDKYKEPFEVINILKEAKEFAAVDLAGEILEDMQDYIADKKPMLESVLEYLTALHLILAITGKAAEETVSEPATEEETMPFDPDTLWSAMKSLAVTLKVEPKEFFGLYIPLLGVKYSTKDRPDLAEMFDAMVYTASVATGTHASTIKECAARFDLTLRHFVENEEHVLPVLNAFRTAAQHVELKAA